MLKNVASQVIGVQMVSATDGSAFTGSVTVSVTGDAGTQATGSVGSGACTHEGNGFHTYAPAQAETNYNHVAFTFTGTGAVPATVQIYTLPTTGVLAPTTAGRTLDVTAGGNAGIDWANVETPGSTVSLSATTVATVTTTTTATTATNLTNLPTIPANWLTAAGTHSDFGTEIGTAVWATATRSLTILDEDSTTLDLNATILAAVGLASANLDTQLADIETKVDDLETRLGTPSDLGSGATVAANLVDIEAQTDDIGVAGAGLTALATAAELAKVPKSDSNVVWNATAAAQIQSEANDALVAYDPPTKAELDAAAANVSVDEIQATALADLFNTDSGTTYASAVAGSVVAEIADNAGGASLTVQDIVDGVWDEDATGHQTTGTFGQAIGDPGASTETLYKAIITDPAGTNIAADIIAIKAETASILTDTAEIGAAGAGLTVLATAAEMAKVPKSDSNVTWNATALASIQSEANDALVAYDPPTRAELTSDTNSILARLRGLVIAEGTIGDTANDTTHVHLEGLAYGNDEINDHILVILDVSASLYYATRITDWATAGDLATVDTLPFTPEASVDTYWLLAAQASAGGSAPTAAQVADAVWEEAQADHASAGTFGEIATEIASILADTNELQTDDTPGALADIDAKIDTIDDFLDTEIAAIVTAVGTTIPGLIGTPGDFGSGTSTIAANLQDMADNGTATFDRSTDSLQAIRDHIGDGTNLTEAGGTGDQLTAINLPNQTMDITGNITGNLSGSVGSVTGNVGGSVGSLATQAKADVNAEVDAAIETYHLDHLLAVTYDPASKPGAADALLNELVESDSGVSRFTANALEQAPTGGSAPTVEQIRTEMDSNSTQLAAIVADTNEMQGDLADGGRLDLLIDAIKAKTDPLTFTVSNQVDSNAKSMNDTTINGDGTSGDLWRGA